MSALRRIFGRFIKPAHGRGFIRDERGTTAIEFAILGVPFFALLGAILETAYVFLAGQILDTAVQDAGRYIRTGQAQAVSGFNISNFRTAICDELYGLFDCSKLRINIQPVTNFSSATVTSPLPTTCTTTSCDWAIPEVYTPGNGSDIILVRVYYKWPTILTLGGFTLQNTGAGSRLLGSVRVFRNEPF
jgi:Flp pilus assembly protein TadG